MRISTTRSFQPAGTTQTEFAQALGWTKVRLSELIKGKRGVTAVAARRRKAA